MSEETPDLCLNVPRPTSPPEGKFNGHYECTTTGWQWYDDIDLTDEENGD